MTQTFQRIGCVADVSRKARKTLRHLIDEHGVIDLHKHDEPVDVIIVLGGDGFMLHSLHSYMSYNVPFYGLNTGTVGFLMNGFLEENIIERLHTAKVEAIRPLKMQATTYDGQVHKGLAINEVSLLRQSNQAAHISIDIDGTNCMEEMICDGVLVATPAGSSAYNFSAGGSIVPFCSHILALTPISPFRPRRWRGALLPHTAQIEFKILEWEKRPVNIVADFNEIQDVVSVHIQEDPRKRIRLLFDPEHSLEKRIIQEQFSH